MIDMRMSVTVRCELEDGHEGEHEIVMKATRPQGRIVWSTST